MERAEYPKKVFQVFNGKTAKPSNYLGKLERSHCDLSLESWFKRGIIPKWHYFMLVNYYNLPRNIIKSGVPSIFRA